MISLKHSLSLLFPSNKITPLLCVYFTVKVYFLMIFLYLPEDEKYIKGFPILLASDCFLSLFVKLLLKFVGHQVMDDDLHQHQKLLHSDQGMSFSLWRTSLLFNLNRKLIISYKISVSLICVISSWSKILHQNVNLVIVFVDKGGCVFYLALLIKMSTWVTVHRNSAWVSSVEVVSQLHNVGTQCK